MAKLKTQLDSHISSNYSAWAKSLRCCSSFISFYHFKFYQLQELYLPPNSKTGFPEIWIILFHNNVMRSDKRLYVPSTAEAQWQSTVLMPSMSSLTKICGFLLFYNVLLWCSWKVSRVCFKFYWFSLFRRFISRFPRILNKKANSEGIKNTWNVYLTYLLCVTQ